MSLEQIALLKNCTLMSTRPDSRRKIRPVYVPDSRSPYVFVEVPINGLSVRSCSGQINLRIQVKRNGGCKILTNIVGLFCQVLAKLSACSCQLQNVEVTCAERAFVLR
jgi:hypothetical protein